MASRPLDPPAGLGRRYFGNQKARSASIAQMSNPSASTAIRVDNNLTSASGAALSVQAKPDELATTSLQALKQRAHQLLESQRNLQQQNQVLATDRQSLQSERDELATQCLEIRATLDALQAERKTLLEQQEALGSARDGLLTALRHVFPYASYLDQRPDLISLNDNDLVDHFVNTGIREGVNLDVRAGEGELKQLRASLEEASAKTELIKEKTRHTAAQLDVLKDIFIRMAVQP